MLAFLKWVLKLGTKICSACCLVLFSDWRTKKNGCCVLSNSVSVCSATSSYAFYLYSLNSFLMPQTVHRTIPVVLFSSLHILARWKLKGFTGICRWFLGCCEPGNGEGAFLACSGRNHKLSALLSLVSHSWVYREVCVGSRDSWDDRYATAPGRW